MQHRKCKIKFPNRRDYRTSISRQRQRRSNNEKKKRKKFIEISWARIFVLLFCCKDWRCVLSVRMTSPETNTNRWDNMYSVFSFEKDEPVLLASMSHISCVFIWNKCFHFFRWKIFPYTICSTKKYKFTGCQFSTPKKFFFYLATVYLYDFSRRNRRSNIALKDINQNKKKRHNVTVK